ncbi:hypothetical protein J6590_011447 [Homalodisca vitripennis]|nr:hypothetical protein J6590_011447 [Homalodisca vitripennis]
MNVDLRTYGPLMNGVRIINRACKRFPPQQKPRNFHWSSKLVLSGRSERPRPRTDGRTDCPKVPFLDVLLPNKQSSGVDIRSLHFQRHAPTPGDAAAWNAPDERNDFYNRPPPPFPAPRGGQHLLCIVKEDKTRFVVSVISWRSVSAVEVSVTMTMVSRGSGVSIVQRDKAAGRSQLKSRRNSLPSFA